MSLLIGVPCNGAIVIGADSAATSGGLFDSTIQQTAKKIRVIRDTTILGVAGPEALAQRYLGALGEVLAQKYMRLDVEQSVVDLEPYAFAGCLDEHISAALAHFIKTAVLFRELLGAEKSVNTHLGEALIAVCSKGKPTLYTTSSTCVTERVEPGAFECIGSGKRLADPFLAFLRRILWQNSVPDVGIGELSVVWALRHAIELNTGGVAEPIEIYTLSIDGERTVVETSDTEKIAGYHDRIEDIEKQMHDFAVLPQSNTQVPVGPDEADR